MKRAFPAVLLLFLLSCSAWPWSSQRPASNPCGEIEAAWQSIEGHPYVWGGESFEEGGFDCSGAIYHVQKEIGRPVPRTTSRKYAILAAGDEKHWQAGECGDWIWWTFSPDRPYGHIGMHVENPRAWQSGSSTGPAGIRLFEGGFWDRHFEVSKSLS